MYKYIPDKKNDAPATDEMEIKIQYRAVELLHSFITVPVDKQINANAFNFDVNSEFQLNKEQKLIIAIISVKISDEKKETDLGALICSHIYSVENFDQVIKQNEKGEPQMPEQLVAMINQTAINTTRGVMWSTFKGTMLHNAVLPLIF